MVNRVRTGLFPVPSFKGFAAGGASFILAVKRRITT